MSILRTQKRLIQQFNKLPLYCTVVSQPLPLPQVFSFVRIGGQLAGEQSVINTQILSQLRDATAANDAVWGQH